jgi:hypothetical protein
MSRLRGLSILMLAAAATTAGSARGDGNGNENESWLQWGAPARSGVGQGATKIALGVDWAPTNGTLRIDGQIEHMLRDHFGLIGRFGVPLTGDWIAPVLLGVRFHAPPLSPLSAFLGASAGIAWLHPAGQGGRVDPIVSGEAGLTFYYFGLFFFEAGGRYDFVRFAAPSGAIDFSGPVIEGSTGVYF